MLQGIKLMGVMGSSDQGFYRIATQASENLQIHVNVCV
jgi:hypothetical protein